METTTSPAIGQIAPEFRLKGPGGQFVTLSEYRGRNPVVLVFYPLAFSPVCSHQLPAIQKELPRISARGAVVLGISVDNHYANDRFARAHGLNFPLLSDFDRATSRAYGVLDDQRGYSRRALFLVDKQGVVRFKEVTIGPAESPQMPSHQRALDSLDSNS